ncbi:MAG: hypothetical protein FHK79_21955 [Pseudomonas sp.]|nr:MAG: hypothetical protein FHK79_21955 [Pseudomonas sp.]
MKNIIVTHGNQSANPSNKISSLWDGLSPHLIASIFEVDHKGYPINETVVRAVPTGDFTMEAGFNWQSPFENSGPESKAPALMSMIQSGALQPLLESGAKVVEGAFGKRAGDKIRGATIAVGEARGRTGMTKLNSTQVFSGAPPIKFSAELLLRAWRDPEAEVEQPLEQLMAWALPKQLAPEGTMLSGALDYIAGEKTILEAALPSESPTLLAIAYKGRVYGPLVIESITVPLHSNVDKLGRFVELLLPVVFSTLTAWDRADWKYARLNR